MDQQKRRKREQEKQKRERLVKSKADSFPSRSSHSPALPPHFPTLKRTDGQSDELTRMTKNILGPYDACQEAIFQSISHNQQHQLLGTFEATPSTPLHVSGNPFDRQFGRSADSFPSATTAATTKSSLTSTSTSSSLSFSQSGSSTHSRDHHNRHSVAEAPGGKSDEKSGKQPRGSSTQPRSDRSSGYSSKLSRQSSDSKQSTFKKSASKSQQGEGGSLSSEMPGSSRPSNVLPVRKKEKTRVRPFKSGGGVSPTIHSGSTLSKKAVTTGSSQGAGELFRVDGEQGGASRFATPVGTEATPLSHPRTVTPPIPPSSSSKKPAKLKKRHSHHSSFSSFPAPPPNQDMTTPTQDVLPGNNTLPSGGSSAPQTMRKSNSFQSSVPLAASSSSSSSQHKHRKQTTGTTGMTSTVHSSSAKKHSSSFQLSPSSSQPSLSSVKTTAASTAFKTDPTTVDNYPAFSSFPRSSSSSSLPPSSTAMLTAGKSDATSSRFAEEKQTKRRKRKRKEKTQEVGTGPDGTGGKKLQIKSEPFDDATKALSELHSDRTERKNLDQQPTKSLSNLLLPPAGEETRTHTKAVKSEKMCKPRPSNLIIDSYGDNTAEESPLDIKDVHSLLKELMSNVSVPSPITPLPTPRGFTFPQSPSQTGIVKREYVTEAPPISPAHEMSESDSSASSSSESSSESSDCEEDNEQGQEKAKGIFPEDHLPMEEGEDSAYLGWEKVLPTVDDSITPLKKTPPHLVANTPQLSSVIPAGFHLPTISPLAPDTPAHSQPSFTSLLSSSFSSSSPPKPSVSSFSGFGGFILGANVISGTQTSSEVPNPSSSSQSLDFLHTSTAGVPAYSQASTNTAFFEASTDSLGFSSSLTSVVTTSLLEPAAVGEVSGSDSDGEGGGGESGSESDDESSDGEEDSDGSSSSGDEAEEKIHRDPSAQPPLLETMAMAPKSSVGSSISSALFFSGDDSFSFQGGGFFNDEDFLSRLQAGAENTEMDMDDALPHEPGNSELQPTSLDLQQPVSGEGLGGEKSPLQMTVPPTQLETFVSSDATLTTNSRTQPPAGGVTATDTSATAMVTPSRVTTQVSLDTATSQSAGKKRKIERQSSLDAAADLAPLPPPARKTPRTIGPASRVRRNSSLSSFSVSSDSSSGSSDSSGDESSDAEEEEHPLNSVVHLFPPKLTVLGHASSSTAPPSTSDVFSQNTAALPVHHTANVQPLTNRRGSIVAPLQAGGGLEAGEIEEEEMEGEWTDGGTVESLWVKIPLQSVDVQKEQKPKAKVGPYNVTAPSKPPRRRTTADSSAHEDLSRLPGGHHGDDRGIYGHGRDRDDDHHGQYGRTDYRDDGRRSHRGSSWDSRESWGGGRHGGRPGRPHDRDSHHHRNRNWDEYGTYDDSRSRGRSHLSNRNLSAEECLREARKKKHEADRTRPPGIDKAKAYLESVAYFMRHGDAIEREAQSWDGTQTRNPFRLYMDTITLMKYCKSWASDCKQLVALCMRCVSVLYWKLFQLKQTSAANIQKDLQDFFIPTKSTQKSPYPGSLSPIPSPASVGSTASTGSGVGGASSLNSAQDPSPSSQVTVSKQVFSKAAEHLTITGYLHQSLELWQQSNLIVEQYRDFFNTLDRRSGCRITQFSPIAVVADWLEMGARLIHYRS